MLTISEATCQDQHDHDEEQSPHHPAGEIAPIVAVAASWHRPEQQQDQEDKSNGADGHGRGVPGLAGRARAPGDGNQALMASAA